MHWNYQMMYLWRNAQMKNHSIFVKSDHIDNLFHNTNDKCYLHITRILMVDIFDPNPGTVNIHCNLWSSFSCVIRYRSGNKHHDKFVNNLCNYVGYHDGWHMGSTMCLTPRHLTLAPLGVHDISYSKFVILWISTSYVNLDLFA